jgi:predicted dithiol-disulfide oxidoreductase (DUF899 family)
MSLRKYLAKREELRLAEVALMTQMERVSEMRRHLPSGPPLEDYEFEEGPRDLDSGDSPIQRVRLSDTTPDRALIVYHMMFGKLHKGPCPMCTSFVDSLNGMAGHLEQKVELAIVVAADPATFRAHARSRGWNHLRLLSAGESTFKYDLASEDRAGNQDSTMLRYPPKSPTENGHTRVEVEEYLRCGIHKPVAVIGCTPYALGAFGAQNHLRQVLMYLDMYPLQQPECYLAQAPRNSTRRAVWLTKTPAAAFASYGQLLSNGSMSRQATRSTILPCDLRLAASGPLGDIP